MVEMKITSITWTSDVSLLAEASEGLGMDLSAWSSYDLKDDEKLKSCIASFEEADLILLRMSTDPVWDEVVPALERVRR
jgi:hypothetical protein